VAWGLAFFSGFAFVVGLMLGVLIGMRTSPAPEPTRADAYREPHRGREVRGREIVGEGVRVLGPYDQDA
jgi:hypothetical protein